MAKKQRTIQLPDDVFKLADAIETRTGARFNRQVLAAMLQYFFTNPHGPDPLWMEWAVAIERGELSIGDMPDERVQTLTADRLRDSTLLHDDPGEIAEDRSMLLHNMHAGFSDMTRRPETNPVDKVTAYWADMARRPM